MSSIIVEIPNIAKRFNIPTYTTGNIPSNLSAGELIYNLDESIVYLYDGFKLIKINQETNIEIPGIATNGLIFEVDAANTFSYPGSGSIWYDASYQKNNLSLVNSPTFVNSDEIYFNFDGSDDRGIGPSSLSGKSTTQMTLEIWTRPDSTTQRTTLMSKWGRSTLGNFSWLFFLNWFAQGNIYFLVGNSAGTSYSGHSIAHNFSTSVYSHFAVTYNSGAIRMYRNGEFIAASSSGNTTLKDVPTPFAIGLDYDTGTGDNPYRHYDGRIPVSRVYNRILTDAEVQNNFNAVKSRFGL